MAQDAPDKRVAFMKTIKNYIAKELLKIKLRENQKKNCKTTLLFECHQFSLKCEPTH